MKNRYYIGIDPGINGGVAVLDTYGKLLMLEEYSQCKTLTLFWSIDQTINLDIYVEKVGSRPKDSAKSAFTFGENYGYYKGIINSLILKSIAGRNINLIDTNSQTWERAMKCERAASYKQRKINCLERAKEIFPDFKTVNLNTCDALLIAEYGRQISLKEEKI